MANRRHVRFPDLYQNSHAHNYRELVTIENRWLYDTIVSCCSIFSFMCMFCKSLFVLLHFFLLAIVLSVFLRYTDFDQYLQTLLLRKHPHVYNCLNDHVIHQSHLSMGSKWKYRKTSTQTSFLFIVNDINICAHDKVCA